MHNPQVNRTEQNQYYIRDDKNYAWAMPPEVGQKQISGQSQIRPYTGTWDSVKNKAENFASGTEAASVGFTTGASLGNFDEAMGVATAALTFNPDNYAMGRDATRKLQNDLRQRHPIIYGGAEFVGSMTTPLHFFKDTTYTNKARNAFTDTLNASVGYAQSWNDFGTNLAINSIANNIGLGLEKIPFTRSAAIAGRKLVKQGINSYADKMKNIYYYDDK